MSGLGAVKRPPIGLRGRRPRATPRGRWYGILAVAFFFVWLLGMDALLRVAGLPNPQRPGWLRDLLIVVALTPVAVGYASLVRPKIGRALGLIEAIPARAIIDASGIALSFDGSAPELHRWNDISALERAGKHWHLVGPDGSAVATIAPELALPQASMFDAPTLAEAIVEMRPDRYALRGGRFEQGLTEFALRESGDPVGRPRRAGSQRALWLGIVLFIVANVLLFWMLSDRP